MTFKHFVQLIAIGLQARIPMHITGFPGVGKTEFTKSLEAGFARAGVKCKVIILIGSIREPQDFGGFPVSTPDGVRLLPMAWARDAKRLAEDGYMVVVFLDELTTVPPTTQAAMLRLLTENVCGELQLPDYEPGQGRRRLSVRQQRRRMGGGRTGNPGADGEPLVAWRVPDGPRDLVRHDGERLPRAQRSAGAAGRLPAHAPSSAAGADCGVCEGRGARCLAGAAGRSGAAQRPLALGPHVVSGLAPAGRHRSGVAGQSRAPRRRRSPASSAIRRCLSSSTARQLNLPDPEDILKDPRSLVLPDRIDRAYAVCYSLVGAVLNNKTPERWQAAMIALGVACRKNADIPDRGRAHALRQAQPARRADQAARPSAGRSTS